MLPDSPEGTSEGNELLGTQERLQLILGARLKLLNQSVFAIPVNVVTACVVALGLSYSFPLPLLIGWLILTVLVTVWRIFLHRRYLRASSGGQRMSRWVLYFTLGSLSSGAVWGGLCLLLPLHGTVGGFLLLTLVAAGMTAGALTTTVAYWPAYVAYSSGFILPLATVSLANPNPQIAVNGGMVLLYLAVICATAKKMSMVVTHTIELQIDNEALNKSLIQARIERDDARTDKWSTMSQMSHELRTPLNAILGFSETMCAEMFGPLGNAKYLEYIRNVHSSGLHLLKLTADLLQLSQGESGHLSLSEDTVDLEKIVSECLAALSPAAEKAGVALSAAGPGNLPCLRGDEAKIRLIANNLIDNAIKFTPAQGQVGVRVEQSRDGGLVLVVRDTGIGMSPEDIPRAMQPFGRIASPSKHKNEGMGLGLSLCKRLVDIHGAKLAIDSAPDQGTTCTVRFPAVRTALPERDLADCAA